MQNYCKTIGALAAASALAAGNASAEVEYEISAGYANEYIFRGVELGDNLVETSINAATSYNDIGLSAGAWYASFDSGVVSTSELDLYGEASYDLGFATGAVGYIKYINDDTDVFQDDAQEIYFALSRQLAYGIDASLAYYWDIETDNDGYAELGLSRSFPLTECVSLGLGTALGYAVEDGEFANWVTTASLDWAFAENATLSPYVLIAVEGASDAIYGSQNETDVVGGARLSVSF